MIRENTDSFHVLQHLSRYGSVTEEYAKYKLGIKRLSARIDDLKKAGYKVTTKLKKVVKRSGRVTRVVDKYVFGGVA